MTEVGERGLVGEPAPLDTVEDDRAVARQPVIDDSDSDLVRSLEVGQRGSKPMTENVCVVQLAELVLKLLELREERLAPPDVRRGLEEIPEALGGDARGVRFGFVFSGPNRSQRSLERVDV